MEAQYENEKKQKVDSKNEYEEIKTKASLVFEQNSELILEN